MLVDADDAGRLGRSRDRRDGQDQGVGVGVDQRFGQAVGVSSVATGGQVADDGGHVVPVARQGVERDGLLRRRPVEDSDDGGAEHLPTAFGRTLLGPVEQARVRARDNLDELSRAREDFDATEAG